MAKPPPPPSWLQKSRTSSASCLPWECGFVAYLLTFPLFCCTTSHARPNSIRLKYLVHTPRKESFGARRGHCLLNLIDCLISLIDSHSRTNFELIKLKCCSVTQWPTQPNPTHQLATASRTPFWRPNCRVGQRKKYNHKQTSWHGKNRRASWVKVGEAEHLSNLNWLICAAYAVITSFGPVLPEFYLPARFITRLARRFKVISYADVMAAKSVFLHSQAQWRLSNLHVLFIRRHTGGEPGAGNQFA